jgi:hypothetical protein
MDRHWLTYAPSEIDFTGVGVFGSLNRMQIVNASDADPQWPSAKDQTGVVIKPFKPITFQAGIEGHF